MKFEIKNFPNEKSSEKDSHKFLAPSIKIFLAESPQKENKTKSNSKLKSGQCQNSLEVQEHRCRWKLWELWKLWKPPERKTTCEFPTTAKKEENFPSNLDLDLDSVVMLSRSNLKFNFLAFDLTLTKLNFAPFFLSSSCTSQNLKLVDKNGKSYLRRISLFKIWQTLDIFHVIFFTIQLMRVLGLFDSSQLSPVHIPLMFIASLGFGIFSLIVHIVCDRWPEIHVKLFNEFFNLHLQNKDGARVSSDSKSKPSLDKNQTEKRKQEIKDGILQQNSATIEKENEWKKNENAAKAKKKINYREMLICYFPLILYPIVFAYPIFYVLDPQNPLLIISAINPEWKNPVTIFLCICFEVSLGFFRLAYAHFCAYFALSFMATHKEKIQREINKIRDETEQRNPNELIRELSLSLNLFNLCYSSVTFLAKVVALLTGIASGFGCIKFVQTDPIHSAVYFLFFVNSIVAFIGMYSSAYEITCKMEELKQKIRSQIQKDSGAKMPALGNRGEMDHPQIQMYERDEGLKRRMKNRREEIEKLIKSVPSAQIKVGSFKFMERETNLSFIDFIFQQIASLLIAFP